MKKLATACAAGILAASQAPAFAGDISANVALTTNYLFRGISQTGEDHVSPAIQGGLDWSHDSGFYLGAWGSNVQLADFNKNGLTGKTADMELDLYGGFGGETSGGLGYDAGLLYYVYPNTDKLDFLEIYGGVTYTFGTVNTGVTGYYSPDYFAETGSSFYINFAADMPLPADFTAAGSIGYQWIDDNNTFGTPDYLDWKVGVSHPFLGIDVALDLAGTDISKSDCAGGTKLCETRVILTGSKEF